MGLKTVTVATCDGHIGRGDRAQCDGRVVADVSGRVLCEACLDLDIKALLAGEIEGPLEVSRFDPDANNHMAPGTHTSTPDEKSGKCPECGGGPYKALSAHRRKYHGVFVRGAKAVREAPSPAIPFDRAEMAESVAEKIRREKAEDF